jgi:hypothetical protein
MRVCGFRSTSDWYLRQAKYKKKQRLSPQLREDQQDSDGTDDEEDPEEEPVVERTPRNPPAGPKRYSAACRRGDSFKSTIPATLVT